MTTPSSILLHPWAQTLAWTLLHFLWQGAVLGLLAWGSLGLLRSASAKARYGLACGFLVLMVAAPVLTFLGLQQPAPAEVATLTMNLQAGAAIPASQPLVHRLKATLDPSLPWLLAGWALGVLLLSTRFLGSWVRVQRLRRLSATPVPTEWHLVLSRLCRELRLSRTVRLLQSAAVEVPTALGWLRPVILLPVCALTGLAPLQLEAVLAHELAHIRRGDFLVNLLQSFVEVLLFYHPAVWWLSGRIRAERELCCDDVAAALCGDPLLLARALTELEALREPLTPAPTHLALAANGGSLMHRIRHLLQPTLPVTSGARATALAVLAASLLGAAGVAFQDKPKEADPKAEKTTRLGQTEQSQKRTLTMKGEVKLNAEAPEPVVIPGDGSFRVEEKEAGRTRSYFATKNQATYSVDGHATPLDAEGKAWLRSVVKTARKAKVGGETPREMKVLVEVDGAEGATEKVTADGHKVRVQVIEQKGDGPGTIILEDDRDLLLHPKKQIRIIRKGNGGETIDLQGPDGLRHQVEKRIKVTKDGDGPETITIEEEDGPGPKVEKRIRVLKSDRNAGAIVIHEGEEQGSSEKHIKILKRSGLAESGETWTVIEGDDHDVVIGNQGRGTPMPPHPLPNIHLRRPTPPGDKDPQHEMAAIQAELKALQGRLEQLKQQLANEARSPKVKKPVPPVPPPPPAPPAPPPAPPAPKAPGV